MSAILTIGLVFVASWALLSYAGFGLTRLLTFRSLRGQELLLIPFVGLSAIVPLGYWCGWSGRSAVFSLVVTVIVSTFFNLLALARHRGLPFQIRPHALALAAAALTFALGVLPVVRPGRVGPIGPNGDTVLYTNVTAYLEEHGLPAPAPVPSKPAIVQLSFINWGLPLGFNYVHAFVDELTGLKAHESFSLVTAVLVSIAVLALSFLARSVFGLGPRGALFAAFLGAVSPIFLWVHYNDFGMQATSLGLVPVALGVAALSLEEGSPRARFLPALLLSAAFTSYPFAMVPIAGAPLVIYAMLLRLRRSAPLASTMKRLAGIAVLAVLMNVPGVLHVVKLVPTMFRFILGKEFGDIHAHVPWPEIYGLAHHAVASASLPFGVFPPLSTFLGLTALGITVWGTWNMTGTRRLLFLSLVLVYAPLFLWLRFMLDYPYGSFKVLTSSAFAAIIGLVVGIERLLDQRSVPAAATRALVGAFLALVFLTNVYFALRLSNAVVTADLAPLIDMQHVRGLARDGETIHVRNDQGTDLLWVSYFLKNHDLSFRHYSPYYMRRDWPFYRKAIDTDLVLVRQPVLRHEPWAGDIVHENARYTLIRKAPGILVYLEFAKGLRVLDRRQSLQIKVSADRIDVDGTSFPLGFSLLGKRTSLRLGVFAPPGSQIGLREGARQEVTGVTKDPTVIDRSIEELPMALALVNEGSRNILVPGWLEVVDGLRRPDIDPEEVFRRVHEEVIPKSGFFVVDGWYALEEGKLRWTAGRSDSVFRTPSRVTALTIRGFLPDLPGVKTRVVLNGTVLGTIDKTGEFEVRFPLSPGVLGSSPWGHLELSVNRTFNPRALKVSSDSRDLGVLITDIRFLSPELSPAAASSTRKAEDNELLRSLERSRASTTSIVPPSRRSPGITSRAAPAEATLSHDASGGPLAATPRNRRYADALVARGSGALSSAPERQAREDGACRRRVASCATSSPGA